MVKKFTILFSILFCAFFAFQVSAQLQENDISLTLNPEYPGINQNVTANLSSYTLDLNKTNISWILNNQTVFVGVGKKDYSFKTDNTGAPVTIEADIETTNGTFLKKQTTITPTGVDMLWEAPDSYVPPFYKGKALLSAESTVKIVAIPTGGDTGGLNYDWKQDDTEEPGASGYGQNFYLFNNSYLETSNKVEVLISSLVNGNNLGSNKITLTYGKPKIDFYENDPSLGIKWENALTDNFNLNKNGETLVAEPYFFFPKNLSSSDLSFEWSINDSAISTPSPKNKLSVKPNSGVSGQAKIDLSINNVNTLFLTLAKTLNVNF